MRPEGFKNPYSLVDTATCNFVAVDIDEADRNNAAHFAYEAGADAMLEGLKKEGKHTDTLPHGFHINVDKRGYLVFIPEEKE